MRSALRTPSTQLARRVRSHTDRIAPISASSSTEGSPFSLVIAVAAKGPRATMLAVAGNAWQGAWRPAPTPSKAPPELTNGFLALANIIQGSMHPGYVSSSNAVTLGITPSDTAGFKTVGLTPGGSGPGDWNTEPGCFSFPSISGYAPQCGTVMVDTGIASAILGR